MRKKTTIKTIEYANIISTGDHATNTYQSSGQDSKKIERLCQELETVIEENLQGEQQEVFIEEIRKVPDTDISSVKFQQWRKGIEVAANIAGIGSLILEVLGRVL